MVYGEDSSLSHAKLRNTRGRLNTHYDQAGMLTIGQYDPGGAVLRSQRQVLTDYYHEPDWTNQPTVNLEADEYKTVNQFDAGIYGQREPPQHTGSAAAPPTFRRNPPPTRARCRNWRSGRPKPKRWGSRIAGICGPLLKEISGEICAVAPKSARSPPSNPKSLESATPHGTSRTAPPSPKTPERRQ